MPEPVSIEVNGSLNAKLCICVNPWIASVRNGDSIEWTLTSTLSPATIVRMVGLDKALPVVLSSTNTTKEHGAFLHSGLSKEPEEGHYQIVLEVQGETIQLDPDYRVRP